MRPYFRPLSDASLSRATETDLRLYVAHQRYNVRARRLASKELQRRMTLMQNSAADQPRQSAVDPPHPPKRPKGSLADVAWLGVLLGAGAMSLHVIRWWGGF